MKASIALVIFGLIAASAVKVDHIKPYEFTPGKMYLYDYSAALLTGIPKIADQFAGLKMKAQIALQAKSSSEQVEMKLTEIEISRSKDLKSADALHADEEKLTEEMPQKWIQEYIRELGKTIKFTHQKGQVINFVADESEPEWSLNIKKSILTLFHLNLEPKQVMRSTDANEIAKPVSHQDLTFYGVYESGINGICESAYELVQVPSLDPAHRLETRDVLNVTKTKNYRNCLTRSTLPLKDNMSSKHSPRKSSASTFEQVVRGYYPIPKVNSPSDSPIKQYSSIKYNMSMVEDVAQIESIRSEGKIIYATFGANIVAYTHQKVTLRRVTPSQQSLGSIGKPVDHEELSYRFPKLNKEFSQIAMDLPHMSLYSREKIDELTQNLPKLFQQLASSLVSDQNDDKALRKVVQVVVVLSALPKEQMESMFESIAQVGGQDSASVENKFARKMFLDALALTGSNEAAKLIAKLITNRQISSQEAREMLASLPRNMNLPTSETLNEYLQLLHTQRVQSDNSLYPTVAVTFGKMVNTAFAKIGQITSRQQGQEKENSFVSDSVLELTENENKNNQWQSQWRSAAPKNEDLERYIVAVSRLLENADNFSKKVAAIECLAHMGNRRVLAILEPYISGSASTESLPGYQVENESDLMKERNFLRTLAIYSLAHIAPNNSKQVLPLVLPVYRNSAEPHEMRLAAFTIAMLCSPEEHIIESIASDLYHESNKQVINFVVSALNSIGNLTTPCQRSLARAAAQAVESAPKRSTKSSMFSTYKSGDFFDAKHMSGMWFVAQSIKSHITPIPRAGYLAAAQISSPFHDDFLEIGFQGKGLEHIAQRIVGSNGLVARLFQAKQQSKRQSEQVARDAKLHEAAKLNLFVKLFQQSTIYPLDEEMINQYVQQLDKWTRDVIAQGYSGTFVKILMPSTISKLTVSEIGLPVIIAQKRPLIVSLKINRLNAEQNTHSNGAVKGYTLSTEIEPRVMYSSYVFVAGIEPVSKTTVGTYVEKTYQLYAPLRASLTHQHESENWSLLVQPKTGYEAVYHKSEASNFLSKARVVFSPSREWLESSETIRKENSSPVRVEKTLSHSKVPVVAKVLIESEKSELDQSAIRKSIAKNGLIPTLVSIFRNSELNTRTVRIQLQQNSAKQEKEMKFQWNTKQLRREESNYEIDDQEQCPKGLYDEIVRRVTSAITGEKIEKINQCEKKSLRDVAKWYSTSRDNLKWIENGNRDNMTPEEREEQERELDEQTRRHKSSAIQFTGNSQFEMMKTEFVVRKNQACFTTQPVLACAQDATATSTRKVTRGFHCMPRSSPLTQQFMKDAETTVLKELADKRVDFREELTVPKACSA